MVHVGRYRVRRGLFGKAVLQSLVKVEGIFDSSRPGYRWQDMPYILAPDALIAPSYPYKHITNTQEGDL